MTVRRATAGDLAALEELWRAFERELPPPEHHDVDEDEELAEIRGLVANGLAFVAEEDGALVGFALGDMRRAGLGKLMDLYVDGRARRRGVAAALTAAVVEALAERGARHVEVEVVSSNADARSVYQHWGFREDSVTLAAPVDHLRERLEAGRHAVSFASLHVQSDDRGEVERAVFAYAPRVGSKGTQVEGPRNGWTAVYDEACDGDPSVLLRFGREVSSRLGAVVIAVSLELDEVVRLIALDRGGVVDEYLSVPEFYGPLPPGDVIGLAANPTVLARLTGADAAAVKAVARTAAAPTELPPARELLGAIAAALGLEGTEHGYEPEE